MYKLKKLRYYDYLFSGRRAEELRQLQADTRMEAEKVREEKEQLAKLNEEVDAMIKHPLPFSSGDKFEYQGKQISIVGPDDFDERLVKYLDEARELRSASRIELINGYVDYQKRQQLSREREELEQEVEELVDKRRNLQKDFEECDTARIVFRRFPVIRDFVMEIGRRLHYLVDLNPKELVSMFKEKVLGIEQTIERDRHERAL